ncbi:conserved hypothetical protein [Tenacibaculum dicentrarchi]|nr:conserved hypothetical protein [Tenacibaculum dicentrarchi]
MTSNQKLENLFKELNLFNNFKDIFLENAQILKIRKNDFFLKKGEICPYIGIIKSGSIFSFFENDDAEINVNELYSPLSLISSYRSFLTQFPSPASFKANSNTEIYIIHYQQYRNLKNSIEWLNFFKAFSDALFVRKCLKDTTLMSLSTEGRYRLLIKQRRYIEQLFPQHIIASYLKMRPETLSRLKSLDLRQGNNK